MSAKRPIVALTAGAEATRALLMRWEQQAKLTKPQLESLAHVSHLTSERPLPLHLVDSFLEETPEEEVVIATEDDVLSLDLEMISIDPFTSQIDLLSLSSASSDLTFPEELKYQVYIDYLNELQESVEKNSEVQERIQLSLEHLAQTEEEFTEVSKKTSELYQLCEGLLSEERHLKLFGDELRSSLAHFESLEYLWHQFSNANLSAEDAHFINLLKRIDDGIDYFRRHPTIRESEAYRLKFKSLQTRALTMLKDYVVAFLRQLSITQSAPARMTTVAASASNAEYEKQKAKELASSGPKDAALPPSTPSTSTTPTSASPATTPSLSRQSTAATLASSSSSGLPANSLEELERQLATKNAQFKMVAARLKPLCEEVERRASQREYAILLNDILNAYFQLRRTSISDIVTKHIASIVSPGDVFKMVREGFIYFVNLCEDEYAHCTSIFSSKSLIMAAPLQLEASAGGAGANSSSLASVGGSSSSLSFIQGGAIPSSSTSSSPSAAMGALRSMIEGCFSTLYDHLRASMLRTSDLTRLCSLIDILQYEIMEACIERRPQQLAPLKAICERVMEDVRDRLIFVSDIFIRDEIADYSPSLEELDYPSRLEKAMIKRREAMAMSASMEPSAKEKKDGEKAIEEESGSGGDGEEGNGPSSSATGEPQTSTSIASATPTTTSMDSFQSFSFQSQAHAWFPTLERTLQLLAKLYVAIDAQTFDGIGQDAVLTCSKSLCAASKRIEAIHGHLDGYLFLIKYLVILQENIRPFAIDFFVMERNLDFSHTRDLLRRLMAGELPISSIFAFSTNNALLRILQSAAPKLTYSEKDLSKAMEEILTQTMEAFILSSTQRLIDPLLSFVTQARAFMQQERGGSNGKGVTVPSPEGANPPSPPPASPSPSSSHSSSLSLQPFASPPTVAALFTTVSVHLRKEIPSIMAKIRLYLELHHNATLLFNPIKANVLDALDNFLTIISKEYTPDEATLITTSSPENLSSSHMAESLLTTSFSAPSSSL